MLKTLGSIEFTIQLGEGIIGVDSHSRAECDGSELDGSEIDDGEVDGGKVDNKAGKKGQKIV